jgi:SAM-dependent methyltransferase
VPGSSLFPPAPRFGDALPARVRAWWRGYPQLLLEDTGAFLLPGLLPLRARDRLLVLDNAALAEALGARGGLTTAPTIAWTRADPSGGGVVTAADTLPFADASFTVVVAGHRLRAWDDDLALAFLRECWRVLTHNGIVVLWEVAPSRSVRVNAIWRRILPEREPRLRSFAELGRLGREAGFAWMQTMGLRPFLWPPGPRLAVLLRKEDYTPATIGLDPGETPD